VLRASQFNGASVSITGGTITGTNAPYELGGSAIPFIWCSSGTMGNNGAMSGITALLYNPGNAWVLLPAGAIAAGVPAAATWYAAQFSSTSAATIFNNTYTGPGVPAWPTALTPFSTTGPGAFTGVSAQTTGPSLTVPANSMGANGYVDIWTAWQHTNSAASKIVIVSFGATNVLGPTDTTTDYIEKRTMVRNRGVTGVQVSSTTISAALGLAQGGGTKVMTAAVDTTANVTLAFAATNGTPATNNIVLEGFSALEKYAQ